MVRIIVNFASSGIRLGFLRETVKSLGLFLNLGLQSLDVLFKVQVDPVVTSLVEVLCQERDQISLILQQLPFGNSGLAVRSVQVIRAEVDGDFDGLGTVHGRSRSKCRRSYRTDWLLGRAPGQAK